MKTRPNMKKTEKLTLWGVTANSILFLAKLIVGLSANSLAVLSDAFNSLTDVLSSIGILIAVKVSNKKGDKDHPFGHHRAEPIAGLFVAIFAGILGFEIIKKAIESFSTPHKPLILLPAVIVLVFTMSVKIIMSYVFVRSGKKFNSPAVYASGIDSRNDILVSLIALVGVVTTRFGRYYLDDITAILIGLFIIYSGYKIAKANMDYLMGKAPPKGIINKIKKSALSIRGVKGINEVKAHYVGNFVHIEVHIEVNKGLKTIKSHAIGKEVQRKIESLESIDRAFIHIDPV